MKPNLIVFTNGYEGTWPAIEYGAWLAQNMQTHLTLAGVVESGDAQHPVEDIFSRAVTLFRDCKIEYSLELENGQVEDCIARRKELQVTSIEDYQNIILILGPFGRPQVQRMLIGNSFRKIMGIVSVPILFVPRVRIPIRQVLICLGGLEYALTAENLGIKVAQMNNASITLLTVVPPIDLEYPEAKKIRENWKNLSETDTMSGRILRRELQKALQMGLNASVKVRHGNIVEQILAEIKDGDYDLVCMGSQYSTHSLRQLYTPNITADLAEVNLCPILTARYTEPQK